MGKHGIDDLVYSEAREVVYEQVKWTAAEKAVRGRADTVSSSNLTCSRCLADAVAKSALGALLHVPVEDRADVLEISGRCVPFSDDAEGVLYRARTLQEELDLTRACRLLTTLRLMECGITEVDCRCVENLKTLNLCGNRIAAVRGECLPRGLTYLELSRNGIAEVRSLCRGAPKGLLHLGLRRNGLRDGSGLGSLGSKRMQSLRSLDLSDNDIADLERALRNLSCLRLLILKLEGNPCSMCYSYAPAVSTRCPSILHLDDMRLEPSPRHDPASTTTGCLTFQCDRLTGVRDPGREFWAAQTVTHSYHAEVEIPLFDPVRRVNALLELTGRPVPPGDVLPFPSTRVPWSPAMDFPVVRVRVPYFAGLTELRDVFRSVLTVRVVHTREPERTISRETVAEFGVELESLPWWVASLNYEWEGGEFAERLPGECRGSGNGTPGAPRCHVRFGVERSPDPVVSAVKF